MLQDPNFLQVIFSRSWLGPRELLGDFFAANKVGALKDIFAFTFNKLPPSSSVLRGAIFDLVKEDYLKIVERGLHGEIKYSTKEATKDLSVFLGQEWEVIPLL